MLVTIIIPCYNVEKYIFECIESALNQTYKNIEIICIDNNSNDNTLNILTELKTQNPNKITILEEKKKGAPAARNKGLLEAKGIWIQFLDADDLLIPEKIETQIKLIEDSQDISIIAGTYYRKKVNQESLIINLKQKNVYKALFVTNLGITSANLFKSEDLRKINGWNEDLKSSQETELMFRLIKNNANVCFDYKPLSIIRERENGQISQQDPIKKWNQYIDIRFEIINYLKINFSHFFNSEKKYFYNNLFVQIRTLSKYDISSAHNILKRNFKYRIHIIKNISNIKYKLLYLIFGFKKTEKMIQNIKFYINEKSIR